MASVHLQKFESQKEGTTLRGSHKVEIGDDNRMVESLQANPAEEVGLQVDYDSENRVLKPIDVQGYASNIIDPKLGKKRRRQDKDLTSESNTKLTNDIIFSLHPISFSW